MGISLFMPDTPQAALLRGEAFFHIWGRIDDAAFPATFAFEMPNVGFEAIAIGANSDVEAMRVAWSSPVPVPGALAESQVAIGAPFVGKIPFNAVGGTGSVKAPTVILNGTRGYDSSVLVSIAARPVVEVLCYFKMPHGFPMKRAAQHINLNIAPLGVAESLIEERYVYGRRNFSLRVRYAGGANPVTFRTTGRTLVSASLGMTIEHTLDTQVIGAGGGTIEFVSDNDRAYDLIRLYGTGPTLANDVQISLEVRD